jgi:hypothetical protein
MALAACRNYDGIYNEMPVLLRPAWCLRSIDTLVLHARPELCMRGLHHTRRRRPDSEMIVLIYIERGVVWAWTSLRVLDWLVLSSASRLVS